MKKSTKVLTWIVVLALIGIVGYFAVQQIAFGEFEYGYLPYGESSIQITDLQKDIIKHEDSRCWRTATDCYNPATKTNSGPCNTYCSDLQTWIDYTISTSKYWTIKRTYQSLRERDVSYSESTSLSGNDFDLKATYGSGILGGSCASGSIEYVTNYIFSDKTFSAYLDGTYNEYRYSIRSATNVRVSLVDSINTSIEKTVILSTDFSKGQGRLIMKPSPLTDEVTSTYMGEALSTVTVPGEYKIKISFSGSPYCGYSLASSDIINPSYKSQFGCTKEPNEQYYVKILKEGQSVSLNDLTNFKKFCLVEAPLKLYSNIGSTTDIQSLIDLTESKTLTVPSGQIWSIEYIGKIDSPATACEEGQDFSLNTNECLARTVVRFDCGEGAFIDANTGICIIETAPLPYIYPDVTTHQSIAAKNQLLFTDILNGGRNEIRQNSFTLFDKTFTSNGVSYALTPTKTVSYPTDKSNWAISFNYNDNQAITEGQTIKLNDYTYVKLDSINAWWSGRYKRTSYQLNYLFTIDTSFLETTYNNKVIAVNNKFKAIDGGVVITTTDNVGNTKVNVQKAKLNPGINTFNIDTTNIISIKVRPFITVTTPQYVYNFDAKEALSVTEITPDIYEQLETNINIINQLNATLAEKAAIISKYTDDISKQTEIINALQATTAEKAELIKALTSNVNEQAEIISNLQMTVEQKAQVIKDLTSNINEQATIIKQLELTREEQVKTIESLNLNIADQAKIINQLTVNLEEKAYLVSQLQANNEQQAQLISAMKVSLSDQAGIINALDLKVTDDASIIKNLHLSLEDQGILISKLKLTNTEQAELVNNLQLKVEDQAKLISNLQLTTDQQKELISKLNLRTEEQQQLITQLNQTLTQQQTLIKQLSESKLGKLAQQYNLTPATIVIIAIICSGVIYVLFRLLRKRAKRH